MSTTSQFLNILKRERLGLKKKNKLSGCFLPEVLGICFFKQRKRQGKEKDGVS